MHPRHHSQKLVLTLLAALALHDTSASQSTLFVDDSAQVGGDGESWVGAYADLQLALDRARVEPTVAEIRVAAGLYRPDRSTLDPTLSFELVAGVELLGGFPDGGGPLASRAPELHVTTLSGDLLGDDGTLTETGNIPNSADNSHHVVRASSLPLDTRLDGFTVRAGVVEDFFSSGGGVLVEQGGLSLRQVRITHCTASSRGGGLGATNCEVALDSCSIEFCRASSFGGGAAVSGDSLLVATDCQFSNNIGGSGAGLALAPLPLESVTGVVRLDRCRLENNRGIIGGTAGGGLYLTGESSVIAETQCIGNEANGGGGAFVSDGSARFEVCLFRGNNNEGDGGGAFSATSFSGAVSSPSELISCSMTGNNGGLVAVNLDVALINCTIADNTFLPGPSTFPWPAIFTQQATVVLTDSIVWGNPTLSALGNEQDHLVSIVNGSYVVENSIIEDWAGVLPGTGTPLPPDFVDPLGPDGDAATTADNNYVLRPDSVGVDSGVQSPLAISVPLDVEGRSRLSDGDGNGTVRIDLGAYERRSPKPRHPKRVQDPGLGQLHP